MGDGDDRAKDAAAQHAAKLVRDGMRVGLGSGSTAARFVRALGARARAGLAVTGVATSEATAALAQAEGIALATLEEAPALDLAVDGADAVDPRMDLIKGLGGALLREKIVARAAARFVVIVGADKLVGSLSEARVVPVEVVRFGWSRTQAELAALGATATRRAAAGGAEPFVTDGGNYILDCALADWSDAGVLAARVKAITGVVEHGIFVGMTSQVLVGAPDGRVRTLGA